MFPVRLETPRLVLREFEPSDVDSIHAYASDPEVVRFMIWGPNTSLEETAANLAKQQAGAREEPRLSYELAIDLEGIGVIGGCGMRLQDSSSRTADLGYVLNRAHCGKGYVPEAAAALVDFGFRTLGLHRIWATTDPENIRSSCVLKKLGMRREGLFKQDKLRRGAWADSYLYAILEDEWAARNQRTRVAHAPVTVRPATREDFQGLSTLFAHVDALHLEARPDLYRAVTGARRSAEQIDDEDSLILLAEGPSGILGVAVAFAKTVRANSVLADREFVLLEDLVTHPDHRDKGIGTLLMRGVESWASERNVASVELSVYEFNIEARLFYESVGYRTMTRRLEKHLEGKQPDTAR